MSDIEIGDDLMTVFPQSMSTGTQYIDIRSVSILPMPSLYVDMSFCLCHWSCWSQALFPAVVSLQDSTRLFLAECNPLFTEQMYRLTLGINYLLKQEIIFILTLYSRSIQLVANRQTLALDISSQLVQYYIIFQKSSAKNVLISIFYYKSRIFLLICCINELHIMKLINDKYWSA